MGNWNICIQGTGSHHNPDNDIDANKMAEAFVKELQDAGHQVHHASVTYGSRDLLGQDTFVDSVTNVRHGEN